MSIFLFSVLVALSVSALCSLIEAAVLSLTPSQLADLTNKNPRVGEIWKRFKSRIDRPIAVILILNTAAHTIGATIAGAKFEEHFAGAGLVWFSLLFTYLMLQFTEVLPKSLGVQYNRQIAPWVAFPLEGMIRLFSPLLWVIHQINRPFERKHTDSRPDHTLEEIAALAGLARLSNLIGSHQERIIRGASRLSGMTASEVMIPIEEVTFLSTSQSLADALRIAHDDPHTRFPIHEGTDRNQIVGYVNFKEMVYWAKTNPADPGLRGIIRPVELVRAEEPAPQLLRVFVDHHQHMAIVRDNQGRALGLVTMEDLVEELVGELEDEFDRLPRMLHGLSGGSWMVGGGVLIQELARKLQVELPDAHGTVSAWLIRRFGRVPRSNELYRYDGLEFLVRRIRRHKVFEASVTRQVSRTLAG